MEQKRADKQVKKHENKRGAKMRQPASPEFYEVEKIINHRIDFRRAERKFMVKWKGYDEDDSTWETFRDFARDAPELVQDYLLGFFD